MKRDVAPEAVLDAIEEEDVEGQVRLGEHARAGGCSLREIFGQFAVPNAGRLGHCPLRRDTLLERPSAIITLVGLHTHPLVDWGRCAGTPKRWLISTAVPGRHSLLSVGDSPVLKEDHWETYRIVAR